MFDADGRLRPVADRVLSAALDAQPAGDLRDRLMGHVTSNNPLRTFASRAAAFLQVSLVDIRKVLDAANLPSSAWSLNPTPGVFVQPVASGVELPGAEAFLLRLDADGEVPTHGHTDQEWGFILSGQLADDLGDLKSAGDLVYRNKQDVHRVWNPGTSPGISLNLLMGPQRWVSGSG